MHSVGFEPMISEGERPQTYALGHAATDGQIYIYIYIYVYIYICIYIYNVSIFLIYILKIYSVEIPLICSFAI